MPSFYVIRIPYLVEDGGYFSNLLKKKNPTQELKIKYNHRRNNDSGMEMKSRCDDTLYSSSFNGRSEILGAINTNSAGIFMYDITWWIDSFSQDADSVDLIAA